MSLIRALWVAPFHAQHADGTPLVPGETVCEIPAGEAKDSGNWKPVKGAATPKDEE